MIVHLTHRLGAVTDQEQAVLERIAKASSERVDRTRRARALLAVMRGSPLVESARQAGLGSGSTVAGLVQRFNERGLAALSIAAGRGLKPTYDTEARATVVALAQQDPERRRDGTAASATFPATHRQILTWLFHDLVLWLIETDQVTAFRPRRN